MPFDMQILIFWRCLLVVLLTVLDNAVLFCKFFRCCYYNLCSYKTATQKIDKTKILMKKGRKQILVFLRFAVLTRFYCIQSLYRHVVYNVPVSCKANGDRDELWAWLDSDPKVRCNYST